MLTIPNKYDQQPGHYFAARKGGRPPVIIPKIRVYLRFRAMGYSHRLACRMTGISSSTPYQWRRRLWWYRRALERATSSYIFAASWAIDSAVPTDMPRLGAYACSGRTFLLSFLIEVLRSGIDCPYCKHTGSGVDLSPDVARCDHERRALLAVRDIAGGDFGIILQPVRPEELQDEVVGVLEWHLRLPYPKRGRDGSILYRDRWRAMLNKLQADRMAGRESIFTAPDFSEWPSGERAKERRAGVPPDGEADDDEFDDLDDDEREKLAKWKDAMDRNEPTIRVNVNRSSPFQFKIIGESL